MGINVGSGVKQAPGSGRTIHLIYPAQGTARTVGLGTGNNVSTRGGMTVAAATITSGGASGGIVVNAWYKGAMPLKFQNLVAGDLATLQMSGTFYPIVEQVPHVLTANPMQVFRFLVIAAFPLLPEIGRAHV